MKLSEAREEFEKQSVEEDFYTWVGGQGIVIQNDEDGEEEEEEL